MKTILTMAFVTTAGCGASVAVAQLNPSPRHLTPQATVEVFSGSSPERPFVAVALVSSRQASTAADSAEIIPALKTAAAEFGCDGLILGNRTSKAVGVGDVSYLRGYDATCIVYKIDGIVAGTAGERAAPAPMPSANEQRAPKTSANQRSTTAVDTRAALGQWCDKKDNVSCHYLGEDYELGTYGSKDLRRAVQAYNRACAQGDKNDCRRAALLNQRL